jgi:hypothetical protein
MYGRAIEMKIIASKAHTWKPKDFRARCFREGNPWRTDVVIQKGLGQPVILPLNGNTVGS